MRFQAHQAIAVLSLALSMADISHSFRLMYIPEFEPMHTQQSGARAVGIRTSAFEDTPESTKHACQNWTAAFLVLKTQEIFRHVTDMIDGTCGATIKMWAAVR